VTNIEMRAAFGKELVNQMAIKEKIVVVNADLSGACGTASIAAAYPKRSFNVGVQEANMASFAAGLASYGFIPFIATFATFATRRMCDQLTISIAYAGNNVKVVGTDPGVGAELNGGTHMALEDVGIVRSIPNILIVEPCDVRQLVGLLPQIVDYPGPVYLRLLRKLTPDIFEEGRTFDLLTADRLRDGDDVTLICSGVEVHEALQAAGALANRGVEADVINVHTIKPLDEATILESVRRTGCVVTCENHNVIGGLGSAVAELTAEKAPVPVLRVGVRDRFGEVGKLPDLKVAFGMTAATIVAKALELVGRKQ
jgi:transketolase